MVEAIFEPQLLQGALDKFAEFCGAEIAHLMVADGHRTLLQSTFSVEVDPLLAELEPQFQDINPRVLAIPKMRAGRSTQDRHFITREQIARDTVYQELILPVGLGHFSAVPIVLNRSLTAGVALHRPYEQEEFDNEVIYRHESAAAVCAPVFELSRLIASANAKSAIRVLDSQFAAISIRRDGREVDRNTRMDILFQTGIVKIDANRRFRFIDANADQELSEVLKKRAGAIFANFVVSDASGEPQFVVNIMPLPHLIIAGELVGSLVLVFKPIKGPPKLYSELIRGAFGLTPAEADVAILLFFGKSVSEISDIRAVSKSTTQTLLKRVLSKTESRRQSDLIKKLTAFAK